MAFTVRKNKIQHCVDETWRRFGLFFFLIAHSFCSAAIGSRWKDKVEDLTHLVQPEHAWVETQVVGLIFSRLQNL